MKKLFLACLFFLAPMLGAQPSQFEIPSLDGGMQSNPSPNRIPDNSAALIQNFYTDIEKLGIERKGYEKRDETVLGGGNAVTGLWRFLDVTGQEWIISFSSKTFYKNISGGTPASFGLSATVTEESDCVAHLGKFWCVNGTDSLWWFDGTATTGTVAGAPLGTLIEKWRNRLVIANIAGSLSTIRFSESSDGTNWTLGGNPTDPYSIQIGGAIDGQGVTCLYGAYRDNLIAGRKFDLWAHSGFNQSDVVTRNISSQVGCIQDGSVREKGNALLFMSNRGMESLLGLSIEPISEPVRDIFDIVVKNTAGDRNISVTSEADLEDGTISTATWLATSIQSGFVVLATNTAVDDFVDTSSTNFDAGTLTNVTAADKIGKVTLSSTAAENVHSCIGVPIGFTSGCIAPYYALSYGFKLSTGMTLGAVTLKVLKKGNPGDYGVRVLNDNASEPGTLIQNLTNIDISEISATTGPGEDVILSTTSGGVVLSSGTRYWIQVYPLGACSDPEIEPYLQAGILAGCLDDDTLRYANEGAGPYTNSPYVILYGSYYDLTGNILSQTFDTEITTTNWLWNWGTFTAGSTLNGQTITYEIQTASSAFGTWGGLTSITSGATSSTATVKQFIRYKASLSTDDQSETPELEDVTIAMSTRLRPGGIFTSAPVSVGTDITAWRSVSFVDTQDSGTISYEFNASTEPLVVDWASGDWESINSGGVPSLSTRPYAGIRATFATTVATSSVLMDGFSITWREGSAPKVKSIEYDARYWIALTTNTESGSFNDIVMVYQRNNTWTMLKGINAASFALWNENLYSGDSSGVGYVYKQDIGTADDGSAITSKITTKSYDLGKFNKEKSFRNLYVNYNSKSNFTGDFDVTYSLDQSTTTISLGTLDMTNTSPTSIKKMPFPLSDIVEGREVQYSIRKSGTGNRLKLYDMLTEFELKEAR